MSDLLDGGYYGLDEPITLTARAMLVSDFPVMAKIIVLTEGSGDRRLIERTLRLLYPHLSPYYSFFDFDTQSSPGGASNLVAALKAFSGAGIQHRVVALFDSDAAARDAMRSLDQAKLPANYVVAMLPHLPELERYPTLGPAGLADMDVNGLAASIELYLGKDILADDVAGLLPVQWTGYIAALKCYHGEVSEKRTIQQRYLTLLERCESERSLVGLRDWSGMRAVLGVLFTGFRGTELRTERKLESD